MEDVTRPEGCMDDHLEYLDELRDSGITNMFGATPYIVEEYGIKKDVASKILSYWMKTFSKRHPIKESL